MIDDVRAATKAIGSCFGDKAYGVVGGAPCVLLRWRLTMWTLLSQKVKQLFLISSNFAGSLPTLMLKGKPLQTTYKSAPPVEIEILTPPLLFKEPFDASTPTIFS
jgi:hypothetical protein